MLVKLADLRWWQRRDRPPYLVGNAAGLDLLSPSSRCNASSTV
jgi:hypothetical protein